MSEQNKKSHFRSRQEALAVTEHQIRWQRSPKLAMMSFVLIAGMMGFIVSALLLRCGVMNMAVRYAFALTVGYLTLCASLWFWTGSHPKNVEMDFESIEVSNKQEKTSKSDWGNSVSFGDFDEATFVIVIVLGLFTAVFWFISSAPTLMAELTLDSVVSLQVYHRIRRSDAQPYLYTFWRNTRLPLLFLAIVIVGGAWLLQHIVPEANTLGEMLRLVL